MSPICGIIYNNSCIYAGSHVAPETYVAYKCSTTHSLGWKITQAFVSCQYYNRKYSLHRWKKTMLLHNIIGIITKTEPEGSNF